MRLTIMIKSLLIFVILLTLNLKAQTVKQISGKINEEQLKFIKENYNWNEENIIVINFLQTKRNCQYNAYKNWDVSKKWWENFYSKIDLTNVANRYVYSNAKAAKRIIDSCVYANVPKVVLISSLLTNGFKAGQFLNPQYLLLNAFGGKFNLILSST